jgi:predicted nucleic acid-binding Zn ribbon protein
MSPAHDYQCPVCSRVEKDYILGLDGPKTPKCYHCKAYMLQIISAPTIVFKGKGWAKKDRGTK